MVKIRILGMRTPQTLPCLIDDIARARADGPVAVIVPEQYTLQAEWELTALLGTEGLIDLDVRSPRRLRELIRERGGALPLPVLDDRGAAMAVSRALLEERDALEYYASQVTRPGFPDKLLALIAELGDAGWTPEKLAGHAETCVNRATRAKELDIARVWDASLRLTRGRFTDPEAAAVDMISRVVPSGILTGVHVFVVGFDTLSPDVAGMLLEATRAAASVTVALTMAPPYAPDGRVFVGQRGAAESLLSLAEAYCVPAELEYRDEDPAPRTEALRFLGRHLFARDGETWAGDCPDIALHTAPNPYAEALFAAQTLRGWHESGIPWSEMAIAMGDAGTLPGVTARALRAAGIPCYLTRKENAARHSLCRMAVGSLKACASGFRQQDVLYVLRSGFTRVTGDEALELENYALENGIRNGKWTKPFTRGADAEAMEPLRQRLMEPLVRLHDAIRRMRDAGKAAKALYDLLVETEARDRLLERERELVRRGMLAEAGQNRQIWRTMMDLLDQMYALLSGTRCSMRDLARLAENGIAGAAISGLPPERETVVVGEAGHLMTGRVRALVVMGMQDGVTARDAGALITDGERGDLTAAGGARVGLTQPDWNALRLSDFYRALTLPEEHLLLSCSAGGMNGETQRESGLLADIRRVFPRVRQTGGVGQETLGPLSPEIAVEELAERLRRGDTDALAEPEWREALWRLNRLKEGRRLDRLSEALGSVPEREPLPREIAVPLMQHGEISISRLQRFAACPYRHFVEYGLRPVVRRPFTFEADEKGTFFHAVMQRYTELAADAPGWPDVPDEEVGRLVDEAVRPLCETWADGPLAEDPVGMAEGEEYVRTVRRAAFMFTGHARRSGFSSAGAEVRFGSGGALPPLRLSLPDGSHVLLQGVIDRIDRWEDGGSRYLTVVDYKSSDQRLDPVAIRCGLQLQLLLYLKAASEGEGVLPAGAFYFHIHDPRVRTDEDVAEAAEAALAKEFRLRGVTLRDVSVVRALNGGEGDDVVGKVVTKEGKPAASALSADLEGMRALLRHAAETAASLAARIRAGEIASAPVRTRAYLECDRCRMAGVCGLDRERGTARERDLTDAVRAEAWEALTDAEGKNRDCNQPPDGV